MIMIKTKKSKKAGVRNLPIQSMIRPGLKEKKSMIAKKISEKIKRPVLLAIPLGKRAEIPVSKGTVKQRGMAKKGRWSSTKGR